MTRPTILILFLGSINLVNAQIPKELCVVNDMLFIAIQNTSGDQLWKTDGDCFFLIKECRENEFCQYDRLINFNNNLFFVAYEKQYGTELWKSDGTKEGTEIVKDINIGPSGSNPLYLTVVNETLFFIVDDGVNGKELWKSDGTSAGTILVKKLVINSTVDNPVGRLKSFKDLLFFTVHNSNTLQSELWKSDGSAEGTLRIKSFAGIQFLTSVGETLFFSASDPENGSELWRTDGTSSATTLVKDIYPGPLGSIPEYLTKFNTEVYFSASHPTFGRELWKSDGTPEGTTLVKDIVPGVENGSPVNFKNWNGALYFVSWNGGVQAPLWKTDGTESGTIKIYDFIRDNSVTIPFQFTIANNQLFFVANDGPSGNELWKTDGEQGGTQIVIDTSPLGDGDVYNLVSFKNYLYYTAINDVSYNPWRTNGTLDSTEPLTVQQQSSCQFISYPLLVDRTLGDQSFNLMANASSGLPITYSSQSNKIAIQGSMVSMLTSGRVTITAQQVGDNYFSPAIAVDRSFCINPSTPIISKIEGSEIILKSNYDLGNQWYLNGSPLTGETNSTLTVQEDGEYSAKVIVDGCISQVSNKITAIVTAIDDKFNNREAKFVFPNPVSNSLFIEGDIKVIKVYNSQGLETSIPFHNYNGITVLNCETLSSGQYYVQFKSQDALRSIRFIKINDH